MTVIHILTEGFVSPNVRAVLFPLIVHRAQLRERGVRWRAFQHLNCKIFDCDVLVIESKYHGQRWRLESEEILEEIVASRARVQTLFYLDTSDSTALLHPEVLPYVDRYYKLQLLRDRTEYKVSHYGNRVFANYSHEKFGVKDEMPARSTPVTDGSLLEKLYVWHNSSLADYSWAGRYRMAAYARLPLPIFLRYPEKFTIPTTNRSIDVSCRMGVNYERQTVSWHRQQARAILARWTPTDRISHSQYVKELQDSKVVVSPFGWGEINYKDYETFLAGALLVKPDMSHLETWPELYQSGKTYLAYDWDGENLLETIEGALSERARRHEIAAFGQREYSDHIVGAPAANKVCDRLEDIANACSKSLSD